MSPKATETAAEVAASDPPSLPPAPSTMVQQWCELVREMGPDELAALEERTFAKWDRASLAELRGAIRHRWPQLAGY